MFFNVGRYRSTRAFIPPIYDTDDRLRDMPGRGWRLRLSDGSNPRQKSPLWDLRWSRRPPLRLDEADSNDNAVRQDGSALMRLPVEVRLQIYRLVFGQIRFRWGFLPPDGPLTRCYNAGEFVTPDVDLALLRVCRRMYCEIGDSWLGQVLFFAEDQTSLIHFLDRNPVTRRRIRRVVVREHPGVCPMLGTGFRSSVSRGHGHGQPWPLDPTVALSLMGTTLDAVPLADALAALPGLQLDVLTVLSNGDPWDGYRSLDRFVTHGSGFKTLEFATPHSLLLKHKDLLVGASRLCRAASVAPRAPQPAGWDAKAKKRDGEDSGAGVRLFRASTTGSCGVRASNVVGAEEQEQEQEEEPAMDSARLRPFAVMDPALQTEWAQTAAPDDPARELVARRRQCDAEACMLELELDRELLFVVRRGRGAADARVPWGSNAALGKAWWSCCPDGLCERCMGPAGRNFHAPVSWEERGEVEAGLDSLRRADGEEEGEQEQEDEEDEEDEDEDEVVVDGPGEGPSSRRPLNAAEWRSRFGPSEEHSPLSMTRSGRWRQMAMKADRRTAARVYLDNFWFLYPYQGLYRDVINGHDVGYSVTKDRCWEGSVDEYGTWGVFGAMDRYMAR